jgi:hypothetical protein
LSRSEKITRSPDQLPQPLPLSEHPSIKWLRAFQHYYAEILRFTWVETLHFFGWNKRTLLVPFLWVVGAITAFSTLDGPVVRDEILTAFAFGLIPVVALAVLVAVVNIVHAPYALAVNERAANDAINSTYAEQLNEKKRAIKQLTDDLQERHKEIRFYKEQKELNYNEASRLRDKVSTLEEGVKRLEASKLELEERFLPELTIVHLENGEHFFQDYNGVKQFRVAAVSTASMNDAEMVANFVVLTDGVLNLRYSRLHMRPMHDRNERGTRRVIMKPFEYEYWDVISEDSGHVWLNHIRSH